MQTTVKRRWSITPLDGVAIVTEQPAARRVSPSAFVDVRPSRPNAALESTAALLRMVSAGALREVPRG